MRDLTSRLRDIVRQDRRQPSAPARELTYVPDPDASGPVASAADALGGVPLGDGACLVLDHTYAADESHGRRRMEACSPAAGQPIHLFDARLSDHPNWWRRVVFFDIETTGLSGGAGTLAFLAGCGWFEDDGGFRVRQFFLAGPSGERALLDALSDVFAQASLLVTYNGRTFDVPFMETRWAFHRTSSAADELPHFDMLPPARRLWSRRETTDDDGGCSLSALERSVLGFRRVGDVPGFEIPVRYFQFLRTGDAGLMRGVLDHNRRDLQSLAVLMSHALWMAAEGADACREPHEQLALARIYERAGDHAAARVAFLAAASSRDRDVSCQALAHLAEELRRSGQFDEAAARWQQILDLSNDRALSAVTRRAVEALAMYHEHRRKDMTAARCYAERLERQASGAYRHEVERRVSRIERKRAREEKKTLLSAVEKT